VRRRSTQTECSSSFFKQNTGSGRDQALTTGSECLCGGRIRVAFCPSSSWPGLSRPSTPYFLIPRKTWMPGIADKFTQSAQGRLLRPGMTEISCLRRTPCRGVHFKHEFPSRGAMRPSFARTSSLCHQRAWGMPDARCTRSLVCAYW